MNIRISWRFLIFYFLFFSLSYSVTQENISIPFTADEKGNMGIPGKSKDPFEPLNFKEASLVFSKSSYTLHGQEDWAKPLVCRDITSLYVVEYLSCGNGRTFGKIFQVLLKTSGQSDHVILGVVIKGEVPSKFDSYEAITDEAEKKKQKHLCFLEPQFYLDPSIDEKWIECIKWPGSLKKLVVTKALKEKLGKAANISEIESLEFNEGLSWKGTEFIDSSLLWFFEKTHRGGIRINSNVSRDFRTATEIEVGRGFPQYEFRVPSEVKTCEFTFKCKNDTTNERITVIERRQINFPRHIPECKALQAEQVTSPKDPRNLTCGLPKISCQ